MGYRIELLYENKNENYSLYGESNNFVPVFWALLFYRNHYERHLDRETESVTLKLGLENIKYPIVTFSNETLNCWNDFIYNVKKFEISGSLYLDLGDILSMDYDYEQLVSEDRVDKAINELLESSIIPIDINNIKYYELLGTSRFDNLNEFKYETLKACIPKKERKTRKVSRVIYIFLMSILCIVFTIYGFYELINGSFFLGIITIILFGFGGWLYISQELS